MIKLFFLLIILSLNVIFAASNIDKKIQTNTQKLNSSDDKKENANLKIKELAEKIGITAVGLAKAIAGNTTIGTLEKVADALGVDVVELFAEKEDFVAFVRDKGQIYVFNTIKALKEFTDTANKCANSMRQIGVAVECIKEGE